MQETWYTKRDLQHLNDVHPDFHGTGVSTIDSSWLDHCLSTSDGHNLITGMHVQYGTSCRDHIPLIVDISIESVPELEDTVNDTTSRVDWDKLSVAEKATYVNNTDTILSSVRVPIEAICCKDVNCENERHRNELDIVYNELVGTMSAASDQLKHKRTSFSAQPGWNDHVYGSHKAARDSFVIWRGIGKSRQGYEFDMMRLSRAQFKYALRSAKQQEGTLRRESLAKKLALKPGVHTNDFAPIYGRRAKKLGHASVTSECISPRSAHIPADSLGESGVAGLKVSANHNRCHY